MTIVRNTKLSVNSLGAENSTMHTLICNEDQLQKPFHAPNPDITIPRQRASVVN